ncbi:MAG: DnaJ domain-containing protein [Polyangiaceae bacterium]|nr:DnaJ domain-containing protein [Polyangiaceae bacterium]
MSPLRFVLFAILAYLLVRTVRQYMPKAPKQIPPAKKKRKKRAPLPPPPPPEETIDGKTAHEVLGVSRDASAKEIRAAYQKLVKEYHPDRAATLAPEIREIAETRTRQLNRAYEILTKDD